jgi:antitoxin component YwqK of YwqJK toxin-antitoxin module
MIEAKSSSDENLTMKTTVFVLITLSILLTGCSKTIDVDQLQERGGVYYEVNNQNPYTGLVTRLYENGQKKKEEDYVDGNHHGKRIGWYKNGQKKYEGDYLGGERNGKEIAWSENGAVLYDKKYVDGMEIQ